MLIFMDSFDHYTTAAQGEGKWTTFGATIVPGRTGNGISGSALSFPSKTLNEEYETLTMGIAYKTPAFANNPIKFTNAVLGPEFWLGHLGDGRLRFHWGVFGDGVNSSPTSWVMTANTWYYIEVTCFMTGGPPAHILASARINGAVVLTWDYTHHTGHADLKWATVSMEGVGGGLQSTIDDVYVTDGEFLGDIRIGVLYPNAAGDSAGWSPSPAGNNWQQVEEHTPDEDATYVSANAAGLKDLYNLDDISFGGEIKGVQALWRVKKSDEGLGAVKGIWKSGATEITQSSGYNYLAPNGYYPSSTSYTYNIQAEQNSLFTDDPWTAAEINSLQLGITRTL